MFPPLEQAPDQITSRPPVALSEIVVPIVNVPWPVEPVGTLIPAGEETTLVPLRPLAVTVILAV